MPLFQEPPATAEELERDKPLDVTPDQVLEVDEATWYAKVFRGDRAQLTVRAIATGAALGFVLSFTNVYIALKVGWTLNVALTACILSFSLWGVLARTGAAKTPLTILENNCMQSTASSAGYSTGTALVTAFPAMLLLSVDEQHPKGTQLPWYVLVLWVLCVAGLGVMMAIPMKRGMINHERLRFPTGTAAASLLQSLYAKGSDAVVKARVLLYSALAAMTIPLLRDVDKHAIIPAQSNIFDSRLHIVAKQLDPKLHTFVEKSFNLSEWGIRLDHGVALVGAGAIIGLRTTIWMVLGALYLVLSIGPRAMEWGWVNAKGDLVAAVMKPGTAWKEIGIWYGAPLMVAYSLVMLATQYKTIGRALSGLRGMRGGATGHDEAASRVEVPMSWFAGGTLFWGAALVVLAQVTFQIPFYYGALAVAMTFFLALVAARATGESDITPSGPLGKIMQLTYGIVMPQSTTANLMTASMTASAGSASADLLTDLKSGYLLGAHPRRQFVAQFLGIFVGAVASVLGYYLLVPDAGPMLGDAGKEPAFVAPGAQQWKVVAELFKYGIKNLHPMAQHGIAFGVAWGTALALAESVAPKLKKWLPSATGIGLGLLLPFYTPLAMFLGALFAWLFQAVSSKQAERFTVPIASGLIAGESLIGVVVAGLNNFVFNR